MPVRTLKPAYRGQPSWFNSRKAGRQVFCESNLERDFYILLEFFDWVETFEEQPLTVPYLDADLGAHEYTPDTLVTLQSEGGEERWLYEVKFREDLWANWQDYRWKFRGAVRYCREHGFERFKIITEKEIRGPKLDNVKRFLKKRAAVVDPVLARYLLDQLAGDRTLDVRSLLDRLRGQGVAANQANVTLSHLIATHKVGLDLDLPFSYDTELWLNSN